MARQASFGAIVLACALAVACSEPRRPRPLPETYQRTPDAHSERPGKHSTTTGRHGTSGTVGGGIDTQSGAGMDEERQEQ